MTVLEYAFKLVKHARKDRPLYDEVLRVLFEESLAESNGSVELASKAIGLDGEKFRREGRRVGCYHIPTKKRGCGKRGTLSLVASTLLLVLCWPVDAQIVDTMPAEHGLTWDVPYPGVADGYRFVVRVGGGPWVPYTQLPLLYPRAPEDLSPPDVSRCQPIRYMEFAEGAEIELAIRAYRGTLESANSNVVALLWPRVCTMGFGTDPREDVRACYGVAR